MAAIGVGAFVKVAVGDGTINVTSGDGVTTTVAATTSIVIITGIVSLVTVVPGAPFTPVVSRRASVAVGSLVVVAVTAMNDGAESLQPSRRFDRYRPALLTNKIRATQSAASCFCQVRLRNGRERRAGAGGISWRNRPGDG